MWYVGHAYLEEGATHVSWRRVLSSKFCGCRGSLCLIHQSWTGLSGICLCNNKNDYVQLGLLWPLCTVPGIYFSFSSFSLVKKVHIKKKKSRWGDKERNQNEGVK